MLSIILQRVISVLAGADLEDVFDIVNEYLAVAEITGIERALCRRYNIFDRHLADNDLDLDFREQLRCYGNSAVVFGLVSLYCAYAILFF